MNQMKDISTEKKATKAPGLLSSLMTGRFLTDEKIIAALPYIFFITFLCIVYIANGYYAEKTIRDLYKTNNEIKELRSEYITTKSQLELVKQQSHVAFSIKELELNESMTPPKKIVVEEEEMEQP